MLPDRVSNPRPLTYESGALPIALRGPAFPVCITAEPISYTLTYSFSLNRHCVLFSFHYEFKLNIIAELRRNTLRRQ